MENKHLAARAYVNDKNTIKGEAHMHCTQCNGDDIKVIESRDVADGQAIRRRRMCVSCGTRFTTYERIERPQLIVIKHDKTRELFNRNKLLSGLYRACEKTPVSSLELERLVSEIEDALYACGDNEVSSTKIGEFIRRIRRVFYGN